MKRGVKVDAVLNAKRREALVDAVVQLVAQHGFHGASMRMISDRSGIGLGSMYLHFESRDQLIREAFKEVEGRLLEKAMREYPGAGPTRERFLHLAQALIRHLMLAPGDFLFLDQFLCSPYLQVVPVSTPVQSGRYGRIAELFREGRENRLFKELPLVMLVALGTGPIIQVLRAHLAGMLHLEDGRIAGAAQACWEAVSQA